MAAATLGRAFLTTLGATAAGNEIVDDYIQVLADTNVTGYPYVTIRTTGTPGSETHPLGGRADVTNLIDTNAYLNSLPAPPGVTSSALAPAIARGRELFRTTGCTGCHNVDQSTRVPSFVVAMRTIFPGDNPVTLLASRTPPLNPILNTVASIFDDKMAVVNANIRGDIRGTVMPLLLDLPRKPNHLHDNSVPTLDALLNPGRGATAPHPFYFNDAARRSDTIAFLNSLSTTP